ncbi:hypothetical protein DQ393_01700 [Rhizobium tropici]|uniref:Uncharacterized protein n=1 Tax=Rhizobium tropici TaxID=398 RepID=A0A329YMC0_RHITR|nr:hypothetical protein DQ393_01700 [Rhizobium tropici]
MPCLPLTLALSPLSGRGDDLCSLAKPMMEGRLQVGLSPSPQAGRRWPPFGKLRRPDEGLEMIGVRKRH